MTISAIFHDAHSAEHRPLPGKHDSLSFDGPNGEYISIFCAPHVAAHTAAAFSRAMQAVPAGDGWDYTTKSGVWHITRDAAMGTVYLAQHEDTTGGGDPGYLFAQSDSLIGCMDVIDDIEAEETCTECYALVWQDALIEMADDRFLCRSCLWAEAEHQQGLQEMADDDRAHAMMERAAE